MHMIFAFCAICLTIIRVSGASGNVFKAQFKVSKVEMEKGRNPIVALKEMPRDEDSNAVAFAREYNVLRKLIHPHIVVSCDLYILSEDI